VALCHGIVSAMSTLLVVGGTIVLVVVVLAIGARIGVIRFDLLRGKFTATTRGSGATIENAVSKQGAVVASDATGTKAEIRQVVAKGDIRAEVSDQASPKE